MTTPGKLICGFWPRPIDENFSHISLGVSFIASRAAPMLLDFWITCCTVSMPLGSASFGLKPPTVSEPGVASTIENGVTRPFSSAVPTMNGFIVEPGSNTSVSARLRSCEPDRWWRSPGLKLG